MGEKLDINNIIDKNTKEKKLIFDNYMLNSYIYGIYTIYYNNQSKELIDNFNDWGNKVISLVNFLKKNNAKELVNYFIFPSLEKLEIIEDEKYYLFFKYLCYASLNQSITIKLNNIVTMYINYLMQYGENISYSNVNAFLKQQYNSLYYQLINQYKDKKYLIKYYNEKNIELFISHLYEKPILSSYILEYTDEAEELYNISVNNLFNHTNNDIYIHNFKYTKKYINYHNRLSLNFLYLNDRSDLIELSIIGFINFLDFFHLFNYHTKISNYFKEELLKYAILLNNKISNNDLFKNINIYNVFNSILLNTLNSLNKKYINSDDFIIMIDESIQTYNKYIKNIEYFNDIYKKNKQYLTYNSTINKYLKITNLPQDIFIEVKKQGIILDIVEELHLTKIKNFNITNKSKDLITLILLDKKLSIHKLLFLKNIICLLDEINYQIINDDIIITISYYDQTIKI